MSYTETKIFIKPTRDTANSYPTDIEFTADSNGKVIIAVDDRHLTFDIRDLEKMVMVAKATMEIML